MPAFRAGAERFGFRLVHSSLQSNHVRLRVEAAETRALTRGLQVLLVRLARALNRCIDRKGKVFDDHEHARVLRSPRAVRHALAYVLDDARRHGIRVRGLDAFSSGLWFDGWRERSVIGSRTAGPDAVPAVVPPATWLLRTGWRRHGLLRIEDVPGPRDPQRCRELSRPGRAMAAPARRGYPLPPVSPTPTNPRHAPRATRGAPAPPMKGVILAGGLGTRLFPLTKITNKHLLPVYDRPMIYYPIEAMVKAGITDIMIVTGGRKSGDFLSLLGNGKDFGLKHLNYTYQEGEGGIAEALGLAEHWAAGAPVCVILGDNLIERNIVKAVADFKKQQKGAKILLKEVPDPERFGVATIQNGKVARIVEKPKNPQSNLAVIGIYMYDGRVWEIIKTLKPSDRGELEITDVNNWFIQDGSMTYEVLEGWWTDAGTFKSLHQAAGLVAQGGANKD